MLNIKALIALAAVAGILFLALAFGFYSRGKTIDTLNAQANASAQALALCNTKQLSLEGAIASQNEAIEQLKIDTKKAADDLILARGKMIAKWQVTDNATTCAEQLEQLRTLQQTFYKERE
jgi:parvulin-like peptidyl-prolyl isomerase